MDTKLSLADKTLAKPLEDVILVPVTDFNVLSDRGDLANGLLAELNTNNKVFKAVMYKQIDGSFKLRVDPSDITSIEDNDTFYIVASPDSTSWHCANGRSRSSCEARFSNCYWTQNHTMHSDADAVLSSDNVLTTKPIKELLNNERSLVPPSSSAADLVFSVLTNTDATNGLAKLRRHYLVRLR